ncbi:MAG: hypothetical protein ACPG7F_05620 [Aggregatilineales bacterium]
MRKLTLERITPIILLALLLGMATRIPVDTDTWWHLRSAEYVLENGTIHGDPFSHTKMGETWINHSWGAQIVMQGAYTLLGDAGLGLFTALLAAGGMMLLFRISAGMVYMRAMIIILGAATAAVFWTARPQMISFFLHCLLIYILLDTKRNGIDRLWFILPLMWLWGNLHAGYSIGFIMLGAFVVGEIVNHLTGTAEHKLPRSAIIKLIVITVLAPIVMLLNPYGLDMLLVPFRTVGIGELRQFIQEWNSPNFQGAETFPFIAMIALLFMAAWRSTLKFDWTYFFLISGTMFMALLYGRNIAVYAVVATPILSYFVADVFNSFNLNFRPRQTVTKTLARLNILIAALVVGGYLFYLLATLNPVIIAENQVDFLPVEAVVYMNNSELEGNLFNSYNAGGYIMFAAPDYPVFIDGRTDLYGDFLSTYIRTSSAASGWRDTLAEYDIGIVLIETKASLAVALRDESGWDEVYDDENWSIFTQEAE